MAQAVSVMRWDDIGAPQVVDGKPSEYLDVIKKCLVDGFGTTPSLNWIVVVDEIFTATPLLVLKNDVALGGSGGFIVFQAVNDAAGTLVKVQCCQAYIDRDTLTNPGAYFVFGRDSSSKLLNNWLLIGTHTAFYFFVTRETYVNGNANYFNSQKCIFFFVGDCIALHNNDPATFITMGGSINTDSHTAQTMLNADLAYSNSAAVTNIYALNGSSEFLIHSINSVIGDSNPTGDFDGQNPDITALCECFLIAGNSQSDSVLNVVEMPLLRGKVPGLYFSAESGYTDVPMPFFKEISGTIYFLIPSSRTNASHSWINTEQW